MIGNDQQDLMKERGVDMGSQPPGCEGGPPTGSWVDLKLVFC